MDDHEESQVHAVAERLAAEFPLERARVEEEVWAAYRDRAGARVRTFVPIMVERRARRELRRAR
jgi:hypothetical protein